MKKPGKTAEPEKDQDRNGEPENRRTGERQNRNGERGIGEAEKTKPNRRTGDNERNRRKNRPESERKIFSPIHRFPVSPVRLFKKGISSLKVLCYIRRIDVEEVQSMESGGKDLMQDDPEQQMNDAWSDESTYSPKKTRIGANKNRLLPVLLGIFVVALLAGGIFYFTTGGSAHKEVDPVQVKMAAFEQKIASLESQITDLQA
ncbi:MAG: hypothetical protein EHM36_03345, partial [Deltaproteobacteria bacterium]